jgi:hypothetical protein
MEKINYGLEEAILDKANGLVWSLDGERFAVVDICPYCGQIVGTGLAYRADEPVYAMAGDHARHELMDHIRTDHPDMIE